MAAFPDWPYKDWFPGERAKVTRINDSLIPPKVTPVNPQDPVQIAYRNVLKRDPTREERERSASFLSSVLEKHLRRGGR